VLIVGNLDVETSWARMDAAARRARGGEAPSPRDPRFALPEPVLCWISAAATLLRAFADDDGDRLWTPRPVDPCRMAPHPALPRPVLVSGTLPAEADLWWGRLDPVSCAAGDREYGLRIGGALGLGHPGAAIVRSERELSARGAGCRAWVAKPPYSAAGRSCVRGHGPPDAAQMRRATRLLALHGFLVFEPWVARTADFGTVTLVGGSTARSTSSHVLHVDPNGLFRGITLGSARLAVEEESALLGAAAAVAADLSSVGWHGYFGTDAYRWTDGLGRIRFNALSEVNVRMTFGAVARRVVERCLGGRELEPGIAVSLRFGRGPPPSGTIPLLLPGADGSASAWLEVSSRHAS
jgi:hypothetical protein